MPRILNFDDLHRDRSRFAIRHSASDGDTTPPSGETVTGPAVIASVNHGRWIAECPVPDCAGAELVSFSEPVFFCCECRNASVDHAYLPVVVPDETLRRQVEAYLVARPTPATRNWSGESVRTLRDENGERGIRLE